MTVHGIAHGLNGYVKHGCRCDICRSQHSDYRRRYNRQRTQEVLNGGRPWLETKRSVTIPIMPGVWSEQAACRNSKVLDIPLGYGRHETRWPGMPSARALCNRCPVIDSCRTWVMAHEDDPCPWHVVAAMSPSERNQIRRLVTEERHGGAA